MLFTRLVSTAGLLFTAGHAMPMEQFNPSAALPAIAGAPALDTAGWSLEGGTAVSSASTPTVSPDVAGPEQTTAALTTQAPQLEAPRPSPGVDAIASSAAPVGNLADFSATAAPTAFSTDAVVAATDAATSPSQPFTTLSVDPAAGFNQAASGGNLPPTPTIPQSSSSTLASLDPSAASALATILQGLQGLQDATGTEEGATSKEEPFGGSAAGADAAAASAAPPSPS